MGRLFLVEQGSCEVLMACSICNTFIALHQNLAYDDDFPFWPASDGSVFSSAANLVENAGEANPDRLRPPLFIQLYCVKCGVFMGFRQYYPIDDLPSEEMFSFIYNEKLVDIFTDGA